MKNGGDLMINRIKFRNGRLLLFALLTIFSLLLLGAAEIDLNTQSAAGDRHEAVIRNLVECNRYLSANEGDSWRQVLHTNPMLMLRLETSR
ncbi:MAG: hypothetical protein PHV59_05210 [Victivallales bacterium]|nr:hypothetical protein [Victivallales bacterium]